MQAVLPTLEHRVSNALKESPYLVRRQLRFEAAEGRITLHGRVNSYFQKQMAQEALRAVEGVDEILNQLEVDWT